MTDIVSTPEELEIFNDISELGASLWAATLNVSGLNSDPKMFSVMLYKRLWSHHRGFSLLWNKSLPIEADILARAGLEAAICIAANFKLRDGFVRLMRQDAAMTVKGQVKAHRAGDNMEAVRDAEETLCALLATLPDDAKPARLNWETLARQGGVEVLYGFHRMLSGVSAHVTGLSILRGVASADGKELQEELRALTRKMRLMMMATATLEASMRHAHMIGADDHALTALALTPRMAEISRSWPGVQP